MNTDLVIFILSLAVLSFLLVRWLMKRNRLRHARSWPTVEGVVTSSGVRLEGRGNGQSMLVAEVVYSYSVNGESAAGVLRKDFLISSHADRWIANYPVGASVTIRCNPENGKDSVMDEKDQSRTANPTSSA